MQRVLVTGVAGFIGSHVADHCLRALRMTEWVKKSGPMQPIRFNNIEVPINLPPSWKE
jgi:nucleoside-diphosphate-sugar epimerase